MQIKWERFNHFKVWTLSVLFGNRLPIRVFSLNYSWEKVDMKSAVTIIILSVLVCSFTMFGSSKHIKMTCLQSKISPLFYILDNCFKLFLIDKPNLTRRSLSRFAHNLLRMTPTRTSHTYFHSYFRKVFYLFSLWLQVENCWF